MSPDNDMFGRWRRRHRVRAPVAGLACLVTGLLIVAACGASPASQPRRAAAGSYSGSGSHSADPARTSRSGRPGDASRAWLAASPPLSGSGSGLILRVRLAPYQLPVALSGTTASPDGGHLLIAGGLIRRQRSSAIVLRLDPLTGRVTGAGPLAAPEHDGAAVMLRGRLLVFGGGTATPAADVQRVPARGPGRLTGQLPTPRSDLAAIRIGPTAYLIGGHGDGGYDPAVLATTDGRHFTVSARLPVPVRYPAVVADGSLIWVFGGLTAAGPTTVIQRIDTRTGRAAVAGRLPLPLAAAAAFVLGGRTYLAGGLTDSRPPAASAPVTSGQVLQFDAPTRTVTTVAGLPLPVAYGAVAVTGQTAYLVGGVAGGRTVPAVTTFRLIPRVGSSTRAGPAGPAGPASPASPPGRRATAAAPWLAPAGGPGHLAPGSDPSALPADVLIADHLNNRLVVIDPHGRIRWVFPRPGDLAPGQTFRVPDDAFFSADGRYIVATQEDDQVISVISVAAHRIVYRYGKPGTPGMGPGRLDNPDDAMLMPGGDIVAADIKNCRIVIIAPPAHRPLRVIGHTTNACTHDPPHYFGSPNGAFPLTDGGYLVTEINGDWASAVSLSGHVAWSAHPPGVAYPSDTNEVYPGRYLTTDYSYLGQVVEFGPGGRLLWRFGGLNHPSLAIPLPNGDILVNDDFNDRVIVIDPAIHRIVWQYGHTGVAGRSPGYLDDPDGVDLVPPDSMLIRHAATMGQP